MLSIFLQPTNLRSLEIGNDIWQLQEFEVWYSYWSSPPLYELVFHTRAAREDLALIVMSQEPATSPTARKRSHDGTIVTASPRTTDTQNFNHQLPTPSSGTPSVHDLPTGSRLGSPALSSTGSSLTELTDQTGNTGHLPVQPGVTQAPIKKRKLTFAEREVERALRQQEKETKERQKEQERLRKEDEKRAKDEEKRKKEEVKEAAKREKELERAEKQKVKDTEKAKKKEEKRKKEEEKLKKERVCPLDIPPEF